MKFLTDKTAEALVKKLREKNALPTRSRVRMPTPVVPAQPLALFSVRSKGTEDGWKLQIFLGPYSRNNQFASSYLILANGLPCTRDTTLGSQVQSWTSFPIAAADDDSGWVESTTTNDERIVAVLVNCRDKTWNAGHALRRTNVVPVDGQRIIGYGIPVASVAGGKVAQLHVGLIALTWGVWPAAARVTNVKRNRNDNTLVESVSGVQFENGILVSCSDPEDSVIMTLPESE